MVSTGTLENSLVPEQPPTDTEQAATVAEADTNTSADTGKATPSQPDNPDNTTSFASLMADAAATDTAAAGADSALLNCPEWMQIIHTLRKMPTNNGGPIRNKITEAITAAAEFPDIAKALAGTISDGFYKSNAAGPCKKAALALLQKHLPADVSLEELPKSTPTKARSSKGPLVATPSTSTAARKASAGARGDVAAVGPTWMDVVDSIRYMPTNNGGPIRSRIKDAMNLAASSGDVSSPVLKALQASYEDGMYKSNAAGPMKNAALAVLEKHAPGFKPSPASAYKPKAAPPPGVMVPGPLPAGLPVLAQQGMPPGAMVPGHPESMGELTISYQGVVHVFLGCPAEAVNTIINLAHSQVANLRPSNVPPPVGYGSQASTPSSSRGPKRKAEGSHPASPTSKAPAPAPADDSAAAEPAPPADAAPSPANGK